MGTKHVFTTGDEQVRAELPALLKANRGNAIHLTGSLDEADDLLQQVAVKMLTHAHQFTPGTSLGAWLYRIMRNEFVTRKRRLKRRSTVCMDDLAESVFLLPEAQTNAVLAGEVGALIAKMPRPHRRVMREIATQATYDEVAAKLRIPVATMKSRLWRARRALEAAVA
jgi:RNA polymerase sigma-70 factor (ECF subfamily)